MHDNMKNKINESNGYKCVLCETGEGDKHGLQCSCNKKTFAQELMSSFTADDLRDIADVMDRAYSKPEFNGGELCCKKYLEQYIERLSLK